MSVEEKILQLRKRIKELNLKPTGYNSHGKYNYYQLSDFLPYTIDICLELGLYDEYTEEDGYKTLVVKDVKDSLQARTYKIKTTDVPPIQPSQPNEKVGSAMQRAGSTVQTVGSLDTYYMRYLYRNLLKLTEPDFTEIMAERNALIQAIQQHLPQDVIRNIVTSRSKYRLEDFTNEELRELWHKILMQQQENRGENKND